MATLGDVIKTRRERLGMTQARLAELVGTDGRQVRKWEAGETDPSFGKARLLAVALDLTLDELSGRVPLTDLSGTWHAAWQTTRHAKPVVDLHELIARHTGATVRMEATGDYRWRGDWEVVEDSLFGGFVSVEAGRSTQAVAHLSLHNDADKALGGWAGRYIDGYGGQGYGALARDRDTVERLLAWRMNNPGPFTEWPDI